VIYTIKVINFLRQKIVAKAVLLMALPLGNRQPPFNKPSQQLEQWQGKIIFFTRPPFGNKFLPVGKRGF
jgi:hypothetical protein